MSTLTPEIADDLRLDNQQDFEEDLLVWKVWLTPAFHEARVLWEHRAKISGGWAMSNWRVDRPIVVSGMYIRTHDDKMGLVYADDGPQSFSEGDLIRMAVTLEQIRKVCC